MKILIIGSGGREHAIGWKLLQSLEKRDLYFAPGNGGTVGIGTNISVDPHSHKKIVAFCKQNKVDLVIIGPDEFLAEGLSDTLIKNKINIFGPTRMGAKIEWSKSFAKRLMKKEGIPTADFEEFSEIEQAEKYIKRNTIFPIVIKADGLAAGKGVIIARTKREALSALSKIMKDRVFGKSGDKVVIEEYLEGTEISVHAFCDGKTSVMFPVSQDHKRIFNGDKGPNTGGMGTVCPVPAVTKEHTREIKEKIVIPILKALSARGSPFRGILFPGIMLTKDGPKVIEFNARFGDPETQAYMLLLETDLLKIMLACTNGRLAKVKIRWNKKSCCCVVLTSKGYPGKFKKKISITIGKDNKNLLFHAGTTLKNDRLFTSGGRVIGVTATGNDLREAIHAAYISVRQVKFVGKYYRKDIGKKALL